MQKCKSYYGKTDKPAIEHYKSSVGYCSDELVSQHYACLFVNPNDILIGSGAKPEHIHSVDCHPNLGLLFRRRERRLHHNCSQTPTYLALTSLVAFTIALAPTSPAHHVLL